MKTRIFIALFFILSVFASIVSAQQPTAEPKTVAAGVVNGKSVNLPKPEYPQAALAIRAGGEVKVKVVIDEEGNVVSAAAISGHPLLRAASEKAARVAKFSPTYLSGKAVKITGTIIYNFTPPEAKPEAKANYEEDLRIIALGIGLHFAREMDSPNSDFDSILTEAPDVYPELKPLKSIKGVSKEKKVELIDEAISAFKPKLNASQLWQFELGKNLGEIFAQARKYELSDFKYKVDGAALKANLQKIRDLGASAPADIPAEVLEKVKDIGTLADNGDLAADELLAATVIKTIKFVQTVSPD